MEIKNASNPDDLVTVRESDPYRKDHVRLELGANDHNRRHSNLTRAEARAVAYALLSYAELLPIDLDGGKFTDVRSS
jgi:hypothetical protein